MNITTRIASLSIATALLFAVQSTASAVNWTPTAAGTYSWDDNGNWDAAFPDAASAIANVSLDIVGDQDINLNANRTVGSLTIGDTNSTNNFTINAGSSLIFDNGGTASLTKVANTSTVYDVINSGITLNDNLDVTNNSAFYFTAGIPQGGLRLAGGITGTGGITKLGPGTVSITGGAANTYTGATIVNEGTLIIEAANSIPDASPVSIIATGAGVSAVLRWGLFNQGQNDTIGALTLGGTTTTSQAFINMGFPSTRTLTLGGDVTYDATNNPLGAIMGVGGMSLGRIGLGGATRTFNVGDSSSAANDLSVNQFITDGSIIKDGFGRLAFGTGNGLTNVWVKRGEAFAFQPGGMSQSVLIGDSSGSDNVLVHMERGGATNVVVSGGNTGTATLTGRFGVGSGSQAMSGTIQVGNGFGPHDLTIAVAGSNNFPTYTGDISGNGDLTLDSTGANQLRLFQSSIDHAGSLTAIGSSTVNITAAIGPNVTGVISSTNLLILDGANTYAGDTTVNAGTMDMKSMFLDDASTVFMNGSGIMELHFIGTDDIGSLFFDGVDQGIGTFGAIGSGADFESAFFTGTGLLNVSANGTAPEPSTLLLAVLGLSGLSLMRRRRIRVYAS